MITVPFGVSFDKLSKKKKKELHELSLVCSRDLVIYLFLKIQQTILLWYLLYSRMVWSILKLSTRSLKSLTLPT